jgi:predicted ATPase/DNA-binding SARP family transcriptional activator
VSAVEVGILGPLLLTRRGHVIALGAPKERALIAALALRPAAVVPLERLVELLWGDAPPVSASLTVRSLVSRLRRRLGSEAIGSEGGERGFRLAVEPHAVDAERFRMAVASAKQARAEGDLSSAETALDRAIGEWRGEPVIDLGSSPGAAGERARLVEMHRNAVEERFEVDLLLGRHREIIGELEAQLAQTPLSERLWAFLMVALHRSDRQTEALRAYQRARTALVDALGIEPGTTLRALEAAILTSGGDLGRLLTAEPSNGTSPHPPAVAVRGGATRPFGSDPVPIEHRAAHNLPSPRTDLVGRAQDIRHVQMLLHDEKLVSLVGVGGMGKTRLAMAVASTAVDRFSGGVWFVDLVPFTEDRVTAAIAGAVGVDLRDGPEPLEQLANALANRHMLLVLDNCEHLTEQVAHIVDAILDAAALRVLITSRQPLGLDGEAVMAVPPLDCRAQLDGPAVALFLAQARRAGAAIDHADVGVVASICERLDGIPLAIELAASQLTHLSPTELEAHLDDRFTLLDERRRGRGRRHSNFHQVLAANWALLDPDAQQLLRAMAAFPASFDLEAAEGVGRRCGVEQPIVVIRELVRRATVFSDVRRGSTRYRLLETVKLFASERWAEDGDPGRFAAAHSEWFADRVRTFSPEQRYTSLAVASWCRNSDDDLWAAATHARRNGDLESAAWLTFTPSLAWQVFVDPRARRCLVEAEQLSGADLSDETKVELALAIALSSVARAPHRAPADAARALELTQALGDPARTAMALLVAAFHPAVRQPTEALRRLDHGRRIADDAGLDALSRLITGYRALIQAMTGALDDSIELGRASCADAGPDEYGLWVSLAAIHTAAAIDDPSTARAAMDRTIEIKQRLGIEGIWVYTAQDAMGCAAAGDLHAARKLLDEAIEIAQRAGKDEGLPDLLLVPACAAWHLGDRPRCAAWLTAIRNSHRPTLSYNATAIYRRLRREFDLPTSDPSDLSAVLADARTWLHSHLQ